MIRHISIYQLNDVSKKAEMKEYLQQAGEKCAVVMHAEVHENIAEVPSGTDLPFGDLIQILDFQNKENSAAWPSSKEHKDLVQKTAALRLIAAIDYITEE